MAKQIIEWGKTTIKTKTFSVRINVDVIDAFNKTVEDVQKAGGTLTAARVVEQALADATATAKKELAKRVVNTEEQKEESPAVVPAKAKAGDQCPNCENGKLVDRTSKEKKEPFLGCSNYPDCKYLTK